MKKKLQTTQRLMLRMIIQTKRQTEKGIAAAHDGNVHDVTDDEPQDPNEQEESGHDADNVPRDDETTEDEPGPRVDHNRCANMLTWRGKSGQTCAQNCGLKPPSTWPFFEQRHGWHGK